MNKACRPDGMQKRLCASNSLPYQSLIIYLDQNTDYHYRCVKHTLSPLYQTRSKIIVVDLGKKLQNIKCDKNKNVYAHFTKLNNLHEQLSAMGKILSDNEYSLILLGSLPTSYELTTSTINTATNLSNTDITPDIVMQLVTAKMVIPLDLKQLNHQVKCNREENCLYDRK